MANRSESAKLNWPRWQQVLLIALLVVLIANRMTMLVDTVAMRAGLTGQLAWAGAPARNNPQAEVGFVKVISVDPDSPMARAGVQAGDYFAPQPSYDYLRWPKVGERIEFTLDHQGVRTKRHVIVEPLPMTEEATRQNTKRLLNALAVIVSMLIGCYILWRGWGNKTAMLLGAALVGMGYSGVQLPSWASEPWLAVPMWSLLVMCALCNSLFLPFAMRLFEENICPLPRWQWQAAFVWLGLFASFLAVITRDIVALTNHAGWASSLGYVFILGIASLAVAAAYLIVGWRKSSAEARNRFALIIFALAAYVLGLLATVWSFAQSGSFTGEGWLGYVNALTMGLIAPGLLAYAVLRHKLFDLGFAVNRTLVFGAISAILLVSFGTLEWAVEHLVPEAWHEGSALFSAGIAVGLFLLFHRIRDGVEHVIERLFFRSWHRNEAALKRFVAAAAHVEKPEALAGQFESELSRFSGGAGATLYTRSGGGAYASATGDTIDADDPALSAMRAEQGAVVPAEVHSPVPAALALPMMHQAALAGFVLLGPKPTGEDYRPDEIDVLGWATQQIGLDLQAIRVRELEQSVITLEARNANLSEILAKAAVAKG